MRISGKSLDIEAFRSFLEAAGAAFDAPNVKAAEVLRFRIGKARGAVAQRKDGRLSFGSVARPMYQKFQTELREQRARQRAAAQTGATQ